MMFRHIGIAVLALVTGAGLSGCTDGYGYSGVSVGYGAAGYGNPYYDGYGYGYAPSYYGWYGDYFYPGSGIYVYDHYRRPYRWNGYQQRYWQARARQWRGGDRPGRWDGFDRGGRPGYQGGLPDRGRWNGRPGGDRTDGGVIARQSGAAQPERGRPGGWTGNRPDRGAWSSPRPGGGPRWGGNRGARTR